MGLFSKKEEPKTTLPEMPKLPELPKLPSRELPPLPTSSAEPLISQKKEFPELPAKAPIKEEPVSQLPSFPVNQFSDKFSQDTIKNAITGREEELPPMMEPDEDYQVVAEPMEKESTVERRIIPREMPQTEMPQKSQTPIVESQRRPHFDEPIFVRIDKFEESLKIFDKIKEKVSEIEKLLQETKEIKEKEKIELDTWQEEIQKLKIQIEKVDQDIFSKVE